MSAASPRCGRPMRRNKTASSGPGMTSCGRPALHRGRCRSLEACARYQAADVIRITAKRERDRPAGKARNQRPGRAAVTAVSPVRPSCGTYLAWLLHLARGEAPCIGCALAAIRMLSGQSGRNRAALRRAA